MGNKLISVIVPSFNMEVYLAKCLSSIIVEDKSLLDRIDVLVVNDGSKDRTSEIAHSFADKYPGVFRVIDKENGHYGSCVNAALKVARGLYVKILDADDSYNTKEFERWLSCVAARLEGDDLEEVDLLLTNYLTVNERDESISENRVPIKQDVAVELRSIPRHYVFQMHAVAYRTEMLRSMGYCQTEGIMYTDTEWAVYPMANVRKLLYLPCFVYKYLVTREGQSMDPVVFNRSLWQRVKMYMRMARESHDDKWDSLAQYRMQIQMLFGMRALYLGCVDHSIDEFNARMQSVDDLVRKYGADVYETQNVITVSKFFRFHFVKAWRRTHRLNRLQYTIVRAGISFEKWSCPLKRIVKHVITFGRR